MRPTNNEASHPVIQAWYTHMQGALQHALGMEAVSFEMLEGGASARRYVRAHLPQPVRFSGQSASESTVMVMLASEGAKADEIANTDKTSERWPFLVMQELLATEGIRVPFIVSDHSHLGILLLEDLGDHTLARALKENESKRNTFYFQAVSQMADMHKRMRKRTCSSPTPLYADRLFDETLLRSELEHFVEYGLHAQGVVGPAEAISRLRACFDVLAKQIADHPLGFVHRDYQSRNLMVDRKDGSQFVMIDFQDALTGPRTYDLVALTRDSYQELHEEFIDQLVEHYAKTSASDFASLQQEMLALTVQRKLKDAGRFIFIDRVRHNPAFLPYFEPSLRRVKNALLRLHDQSLFAEIHQLLSIILPQHF